MVFVLIATIAASMVLGGVAVAVTTPKKVSACTTKSHGVRVLGTKVKCHKGEQKLTWRVSGRPGNTGARGPVGAKGLQGAQGKPGLQGARGVAGPKGTTGTVHTVTGTPDTAPADNASYRALAQCSATEQVVGGGFMLDNDASSDSVRATMPYASGGIAGWEVDIKAGSAGPHGVHAYALCAPA
jgi:Collagen triple helix repeat (20 copies)